VLIYPKSRSEGPQPRTFFYGFNRFSASFQVMPAHLHGPGRLGTCFSHTSNTPLSAHSPQISVRGSTRPYFFLLSKIILWAIPSHASPSAWSRHAWNMFFSYSPYPSECSFTPNLGQKVHNPELFFMVSIDSLLHSKSCQTICMAQACLEHVFLRHQIPL
jgi:hypothetical protein